jgi:hypothetical protein
MQTKFTTVLIYYLSKRLEFIYMVEMFEILSL